MKQSAAIIFLLFVGLFFPKTIFAISFFAISFTLSNPQVNNQDITFAATLSDVTNQNCPSGKCYFQGMITRKDKTEYFGFTKNNSGEFKNYVSSVSPDFIKNNFLYCEPVNNACNVDISMRFNHDDPKYDGPGEYLIKMKRYTGESDSGTYADNELQISLDLATPTPSATSTPTDSPTPSPSPSPTATASSTSKPTATPTKKPTSTPSPTSKPSNSPAPTSLGEATSTPKVLGLEDDITSSGGEESASLPPVAMGMIGGGAVFMGIAGVSMWRSRYNNSEPTSFND